MLPFWLTTGCDPWIKWVIGQAVTKLTSAGRNLFTRKVVF
jgi:hypothetical protein